MTVDNVRPEMDPGADGRGKNYKWIALSNTTLGILMVTINQSILLISLPALFRGIKLNPLIPSNTSYFLWIFMGFILVTAVLVVSLGRVGDIYGRVRMYNLGFAVLRAKGQKLTAKSEKRKAKSEQRRAKGGFPTANN